MSTSGTHQKQAVQNSTISDKLATASLSLNRCKGASVELQALKTRYEVKSKRFSWLLSLYKTRFFVAVSVNQAIFTLLVVLLVGSPPSIELILLIMFNFVGIATLLLSSAISFFVLDRMDALSDDADQLCSDIKNFISNRVNSN